MGTDADKLKLSDEVRAIHGELSAASVAFLEYAQRQPEALDPTSFAELGRLEDFALYPLQPWPTFVTKGLVHAMTGRSEAVCALVRAIPQRLFGGEPRRLAEVYGIDEEFARLVAAVTASPTMLEGILARPDWVRTADGFKCLECNIVGWLGTWEGWYWGQAYLRVPLIARFLAEAGLAPRLTYVMRQVLSHILGQALKKFRTGELNIALATPEIDTKFASIARATDGTYQDLLRQLGLRGNVLATDMTDLEERDGAVHIGGRRIHAVMEMHDRPSHDLLYRHWTRGTLLMYNGPCTPVLTDKRNLAILYELRDSPLFNAAEKQVIGDALPWTRRVSPRTLDGKASSITPKRLAGERRRLVLKPGGGASGAGVHVGAFTPEGEWEKVVDQAFEEGDWVAQERCESLPYLYHAGDERGAVTHDVVWSFFALGDRYGGGAARMRPRDDHNIVNYYQGAVLTPLFEVDT